MMLQDPAEILHWLSKPGERPSDDRLQGHLFEISSLLRAHLGGDNPRSSALEPFVAELKDELGQLYAALNRWIAPPNCSRRHG